MFHIEYHTAGIPGPDMRFRWAEFSLHASAPLLFRVANRAGTDYNIIY